ncbi:hypothetical protein BB558_000234 [Smittium angustum]|uniref:Ras-GEF domain-containing protein n=1 Tax=Smittium angustum TaxID=133377 RepID=A0A2U1JER6_SMIAN|nr:hypothetical protein BB558_000234 [Smittium angustum]
MFRSYSNNHKSPKIPDSRKTSCTSSNINYSNESDHLSSFELEMVQYANESDCSIRKKPSNSSVNQSPNLNRANPKIVLKKGNYRIIEPSSIVDNQTYPTHFLMKNVGLKNQSNNRKDTDNNINTLSNKSVQLNVDNIYIKHKTDTFNKLNGGKKYNKSNLSTEHKSHKSNTSFKNSPKDNNLTLIDCNTAIKNLDSLNHQNDNTFHTESSTEPDSPISYTYNKPIVKEKTHATKDISELSDYFTEYNLDNESKNRISAISTPFSSDKLYSLENSLYYSKKEEQPLDLKVDTSLSIMNFPTLESGKKIPHIKEQRRNGIVNNEFDEKSKIKKPLRIYKDIPSNESKLPKDYDTDLSPTMPPPYTNRKVYLSDLDAEPIKDKTFLVKNKLSKPKSEPIRKMGLFILPKEYHSQISALFSQKLLSLMGISLNRGKKNVKSSLSKNTIDDVHIEDSEIDESDILKVYGNEKSLWPLNNTSLSAEIVLGTQIHLMQKRTGRINTDQTNSSYREILFTNSKGLSLWAFVISITDKSWSPTTDMINNLLSTYRLFCTSIDLLRLLIIRYTNCEIELAENSRVMELLNVDYALSKSKIDSRDKKIVQLRVLNIIKHWVKSFRDDFNINKYLKLLLLEFIGFIKSHSGDISQVLIIEARLKLEPLSKVQDLFILSPEPEYQVESPNSITPLSDNYGSRRISELNQSFSGTLYDSSLPTTPHSSNSFGRIIDNNNSSPDLYRQKSSRSGSLGISAQPAYIVEKGADVDKRVNSRNTTPTQLSNKKKLSKKISSSYLLSLLQQKPKTPIIKTSSFQLKKKQDIDQYASDKRNTSNETFQKENIYSFVEKEKNHLSSPENHQTELLEINNQSLGRSYFIKHDPHFKSDFDSGIREKKSNLEKLIVRTDFSRETKNIGIENSKNKPKSAPLQEHITLFDPGFVAEQLTLIEHQLFKNINFTELSKKLIPSIFRDLETYNKSSSQFDMYLNQNLDMIPGVEKIDHSLPNTSALIYWSNCLTNWVIYSILSESTPVSRANVIAHVTHIAYYCLALRNYSGAIALVNGLMNSAIKRLRKTWEHVPDQFQVMMHQIDNIMQPGSNHSVYRESFKAALSGSLGPDYLLAFNPNPDFIYEDSTNILSKSGNKDSYSLQSRNNSVNGVKSFFGFGPNKEKTASFSKVGISPGASFSYENLENMPISPGNSSVHSRNRGFVSDSTQKTTYTTRVNIIPGSDSTLYEKESIQEISLLRNNSKMLNNEVSQMEISDSLNMNSEPETVIQLKRTFSLADIDCINRARYIRNPALAGRKRSSTNKTVDSIFSKNKSNSNITQFSKTGTPNTINRIDQKELTKKRSILGISIDQKNQTQNSIFNKNGNTNGARTSISEDSSLGNSTGLRPSSNSGSVSQFPVIPIFTIHYRDLLFADEANHSYIKPNESTGSFSNLLEFKNSFSQLPNPGAIHNKLSCHNLRSEFGGGNNHKYLKSTSSSMCLQSISKKKLNTPAIINMTKFRLISSILTEFKKSQDLSFPFDKNVKMQNFLKKSILNVEKLVDVLFQKQGVCTDNDFDYRQSVSDNASIVYKSKLYSDTSYEYESKHNSGIEFVSGKNYNDSNTKPTDISFALRNSGGSFSSNEQEHISVNEGSKNTSTQNLKKNPLLKIYLNDVTDNLEDMDVANKGEKSARKSFSELQVDTTSKNPSALISSKTDFRAEKSSSLLKNMDIENVMFMISKSIEPN